MKKIKEKTQTQQIKTEEKEYFLKYPKFFVEPLKPDNLNEILNKTKGFIKNEKVILITSGGTKVFIEKTKIRNIQNFSTGRRGALMCEYFLKQNKKVIFLHSENSMLPFEHNLKNLLTLDNIEVQENKFLFNLKEDKNKILLESIKNYKKYSKNLLFIPYNTVYEYGYYLLELCELLNQGQKTQNKKQSIANMPSKNKNFFSKYRLCLKNMLNDVLLFFTRCSTFPNSGFLEKESEKLLENLLHFQKKYIEYFNKESKRLHNFFHRINCLLEFSLRNRKETIKPRSKKVISEIVVLVNELEQADKDTNINANVIPIEKHKKRTNRMKSRFVLSNHLIILCAAASDFFIPFNQMYDQKIPSNKNLDLHFHTVPKFYKIINKYFSNLKLCIFKLECDPEELIKKSREALKHTDLLVANTLEQRYNYVIIFKKGTGTNRKMSILTKPDTEPMENQIGEYICQNLISTPNC